ncbi:MAG: hypothetical protein H7838_00695 [Magnetococcus sp. DMHC-8]
MAATGKPIGIPIVEESTGRVVGGFCATQEAVSAQELTALAQLKRLRAEADTIKRQLHEGAEQEALLQRLTQLRQEAAVWRARREQATLEKHVALGHATLPVRQFEVG